MKDSMSKGNELAIYSRPSYTYRFNDRFLVEPVSLVSSCCCGRQPLRIGGTRFLLTRCLFCHLASCIRALKERQSIDPRHWPSLALGQRNAINSGRALTYAFRLNKLLTQFLR